MAYSIEQVAAKVRAKRAEKRVSQDELANAIGVSRDAVCAWENGKSTMSFASAWALADFFGCTIDDLFGRSI